MNRLTITIILTVFLCWVSFLGMGAAQLLGKIDISLWWISAPIWGLFALVVAVYTWADRKAPKE